MGLARRLAPVDREAFRADCYPWAPAVHSWLVTGEKVDGELAATVEAAVELPILSRAYAGMRAPLKISLRERQQADAR